MWSVFANRRAPTTGAGLGRLPGTRLLSQSLSNPGFLSALPILALFAVGFAAPLLIVLEFSFLPDRTFGYEGIFTVANYLRAFRESFYLSFLWSFGLATVSVFILFLISYPTAYGLAKVFGRWAPLVMLLFVMPLFVSENIRLFGWVLFLLPKTGVLAGSLEVLFGVEISTMLYTAPSVLFGLVYTYLPFVLFPMVLGTSMVPQDQVEAARDLGASRWQIFREVELPLSMPGFMVGGLITFVLAVGALAEAKILGGATMIVIAHEIQHEMTWAQNWPMGSALAMLLIALTAILVVFIMGRLNFDTLLGFAHGGARMPETVPWMRRVLGGWTGLLLLFTYVPIICVILVSLSKSRYFQFPFSNWGLDWYAKIFASPRVRELFWTSFIIAVLVTVIAVVLGFFGALAFARYKWFGRSIYQKVILLPIFFPQAVLALALLLWYTYLGIIPSWETAVLAHLVWIVPITTLVISIQIYGFDISMEEAAIDLGASRWQVYREVTLPVLAPGIMSGAMFAFLLSWGNFPLSTYTTGADSTLPEWLYAKMTASYTPFVPAIGTVSIASVALITFGGYLFYLWRRRRRVA